MSITEIGSQTIELDTTKCRAYGLCVGLAPDHFEMPAGQPIVTVLKRTVTEEELEEVEEAVDACPAAALRLVTQENTQ